MDEVTSWVNQERLSDLIGPAWGIHGIVYQVLQPLLECQI